MSPAVRRPAGILLGALMALASAMDVGTARAQTPRDTLRPSAAPSSPALPTGAPAVTISAADVLRQAHVLAADSLRAPVAPSATLERLARYVAAQFQQAGLAPAGDLGPGNDPAHRSWLQRYPVAGRSWLDRPRARVVVTTLRATRGKKLLTESGATPRLRAAASFDTAAVFVPTPASATVAMPTRDGGDERRTVLVAGPQTVASLRQAAAELHEAQVLFVPAAVQDSAQLAPVLTELRAQSHGVVVLRGTASVSADGADSDSARFAAQVRAARAEHVRRINAYLREAAAVGWMAEVWAPALAPALAANELDWAALRTATTPIVRPLPFTRVELFAPADPMRSDTTSAPNVIGLLEGSEPARPPLVLTAHLDHTGRWGGAADSLAVSPRAVGSSAELVGLLTLAEAIVRSGMRPRRTILFLAASGGAPSGGIASSSRAGGHAEGGLGQDEWGSNYFLDDRAGLSGIDVGVHLALESLAAVTQDTLRKDTLLGDTLRVAGTETVALPQPLSWLLAAHPELGLALQEEAAAACPAAGCWAERSVFARLRLPSLAVQSVSLARVAGLAERAASTTAATDPPLDAVAQHMAERAARGLEFVYDLAEGLAMTRERPQRSTTNQERRLSPQGQSSQGQVPHSSVP